jgi:hypothetical protein
MLTANSDLDLLAGSGMHAIVDSPDPRASGYILGDEVDMAAGAGTAAWTGTGIGEGALCDPAGSGCGFTMMSALRHDAPSGTLLYTNYGKGVSFWESDKDAARFVNDYQDVVSVDNYWFTDPNICHSSEGGTLVPGGGDLSPSRCRAADNYGRSVERVRSLVSPADSKPVWAFVEVGHPAGEPDAPTITGPEIRAAVWSSIINGARGIVYFNHSFAGACPSQHVLRDCGQALRSTVGAVDAQIASLAPVLNAPFVDGAVTVTGHADVAVKIYDGDLYVIAGSTLPAHQSVSLALRCAAGTRATVIGEDRTVPLEDGVLRDRFADGDSVHIYRVAAQTGCLPT